MTLSILLFSILISICFSYAAVMISLKKQVGKKALVYLTALITLFTFITNVSHYSFSAPGSQALVVFVSALLALSSLLAVVALVVTIKSGEEEGNLTESAIKYVCSINVATLTTLIASAMLLLALLAG